MSVIFVDVETTGLDPERHEIWEMAWCVDYGPIASGFVHHTLRNADPVALSIGNYEFRRGGQRAGQEMVNDRLLLKLLRDNTLCAANPAFDASFLRARWGVAPWNYRLLDIDAYAMGAFLSDEPKGLASIVEALNSGGFGDIPIPDHSAASDVAALRAAYHALQRIYRSRRYPKLDRWDVVV